ncbi:response regulator [Pseudooceanicola sp. CBS1P-1]|nr:MULTISPECIES: ATP-binding protein [Pseudooceanicola]MBT9383039.1 response regulator [Pseudooceanicola endophyticus]
MAFLLLKEIDQLNEADSDNLQWGLSQADVEFLRFHLALEQARADHALLDDMRQRFDIFYSRMATLSRGDVYVGMRTAPGFEQTQSLIMDFLNETVPLIDGPDPDLIKALPHLAEEADKVGETVRAMSLSGLIAFAEISDDKREGLVHTLFGGAAVLAMVFAGLVLLSYALYHLFQLAEQRARDLREAGERTRTIVATSPDAIVVIDDAGTIREFNPAAQAIFGYSRNEARYRNAISLMFPREDAAKLRAGKLHFFEDASYSEDYEQRFEITAIDRNWRRFPAEFSVARAEAGPLLIVYVRDISRRKSSENALKDARDKALAGERAKAEFLAVMSHEMRTPLNGMLGSMQLMHDQQLNDKQNALLERMEYSGNQLLNLVNDVLELSKFEAGKVTAEHRPLSVAELLEGVVETTSPLAAANGNVLRWSWLGSPQDHVIGDQRRIRQILLNLVGNAVKFTRDGHVDIEVEKLGDGKGLEFRVIDSGIGISAEDQERIFQDFETLDSSYARQAGGTGLGLGISRRLTQMMGGEIGVESEPGEGSLFWLRLPLVFAAGAVNRPDAAALPLPVKMRPLNLLLVEDNEINRFVAREMLEKEGHTVSEAVNGAAGVELAEAEDFDVILMDISMPVMDGPEATRRIRASSGASARRPIIAVTAHALPEEIARFREAGMDRAISKPIDRKALLAALAEVTGQAAPTPEAPVLVPEPGTGPAGRAQLLDEERLGILWSGLPPVERGKLMQRFLAEMDSVIPSIAQSDPDAEDGPAGPPAHDLLIARVHQCAGNCGTFGLMGLREALAQIETAGKRGDPINRVELVALITLWQRSRQALTTWLAAQQADTEDTGIPTS